MTRCREFYDKVKKEGNFCGMSETSLNEVTSYIELINERPAFAGFSEGALRPLIREQNEELKKTIMDNILELNTEDRLAKYGTEKKMKEALKRYRYIEPEETKAKKLWNKAEQMEYTEDYVKTMLANNVDLEGIIRIVTIVGKIGATKRAKPYKSWRTDETVKEKKEKDRLEKTGGHMTSEEIARLDAIDMEMRG